MTLTCGVCERAGTECTCGKKFCDEVEYNCFMENFVDLRKEMGEEGFNNWFTKHLLALENLNEMGFASASCLIKTFKHAYSWLSEFEVEYKII